MKCYFCSKVLGKRYIKISGDCIYTRYICNDCGSIIKLLRNEYKRNKHKTIRYMMDYIRSTRSTRLKIKKCEN